MTGTVFVDTNVFVYARDVTRADKQRMSMHWLERLWREQSGRTSMQVLTELYVTLTRKLKPGMGAELAWEDIEALLAWSPQPTDRDLLRQAHEIEGRHKLSWWDSMIVAAAQLQDCELLLTEDLQDGAQFGQVRICSPFRLHSEDAPATYAIGAGVARRHRPRGRPRAAKAALSM
jgi:predicted nucleic acid-binding protein